MSDKDKKELLEELHRLHSCGHIYPFTYDMNSDYDDMQRAYFTAKQKIEEQKEENNIAKNMGFLLFYFMQLYA